MSGDNSNRGLGRTLKRLAGVTAEGAKADRRTMRKLRIARNVAVAGTSVALIGVAAGATGGGTGPSTRGIDRAKASTFRVVSIGCGRPGQAHGYGTGWIYASHYLVTNAHVVEGATEVKLDDAAGRPTDAATVVMYDPVHDAAVLYAPEIQGSGIPLAETSTKPGTEVTLVGHPQGGPLKVTYGKVLAVGKVPGMQDLHGNPSNIDWVNWQGESQPGNSGSPLLNPEGVAVGLHSRGNAMTKMRWSVDIPQIRGELQKAESLTKSVPTDSCPIYQPVSTTAGVSFG